MSYDFSPPQGSSLIAKQTGYNLCYHGVLQVTRGNVLILLPFHRLAKQEEWGRPTHSLLDYFSAHQELANIFYKRGEAWQAIRSLLQVFNSGPVVQKFRKCTNEGLQLYANKTLFIKTGHRL